MSEANKEIIRCYQEAYNTGGLDVLDELLDPNWKTNGWPEGLPQSIESAKETHRNLIEPAFPDMHYETLTLIAEGDWVAQRWVTRATFKGELAGLPPTGQPMECGGISMFRISGGKIVEHYAYVDEAGLWHQLGADVPEVMLALGHHTSE